MKIKKDDNVIVIAGKDKGKSGKVVHALPKEDRVVIEGVNVRKVHKKKTKKGGKGQIVEVTMPIHVSNVMIVDPKTKKGTRIGYKVNGDKKERIAKKSSATI